jgi:nicotinamidase-related amidase
MAESRALIVIDMQVGVLRGCHDAEGVTQRVAALVDRARAADVPVVWVQDHDDHPLGSPTWQLVAPLEARPGDAVIEKTRRDSFVGTDLAEVLETLQAQHLLIAGAQTDYCIRTTTQAAAVRGFDVTLISDAHTTTDAEFEGVPISAEQIIAHTNMYFRGLRYPGQTFAISPHDGVELVS